MAEHSLTFLEWMACAGALFLLVALSSATLRRLPISNSAIYLGLGIVIGPLGFGWAKLDVLSAARWLEPVTEVAVTVSLFILGLKMRLPLRHAAWSAAYRLAGPVMLLSIAGMAMFAHLALGMSLPAGVLLGAVLAPTDPVLASAVSVNTAGDKDRMRYGLSGEAGLNDGAAMPFVILGLHWLAWGGEWNWLPQWGLARVLWAIPAGIVIGFLLGRGLGKLAVWVRSHQVDAKAPNDFLALGLIAIAYVLAEAVGALGFLSVFGAGVGLRSAELSVVKDTPHPDAAAHRGARETHPPAEDLVKHGAAEHTAKEPAVAAGVLVAETISFGDTVERLLELFLVALVGISIADYWNTQAILLAIVFFCVLRPLATRVLLMGTPSTLKQRWLMGWFGIRGIGSLYYLSYSLNRGVQGAAAQQLAELTLTVVAISIVVHGISAQPLLDFYERSLDRKSLRKNAQRELAGRT